MSEKISRAAFRKVYDELILRGEFTEDPDYYRHYWERYWRTLGYVERLLQGPAPRVLDVGSGQFALLCRYLLGARCDVADIDSRYTAVLERHGIGFVQLDLTQAGPPAPPVYDLVVMAEVIEHVPRPPNLVFRDVADCLKPGGALLVTTPNLYRLRNALRLLRGQRLFDHFRFPEKDRPLGHFLEYSLDQMKWQLQEAGLEVEIARLDQLDRGGESRRARIARRLLAPVFRLRPLWQDNLVLAARRPAPAQATDGAGEGPSGSGSGMPKSGFERRPSTQR